MSVSSTYPSTHQAPLDRVAAVRAFNRFYTEQIGVLKDGMVHTPYPLPEARLLYEVGQRGRTSGSELAEALDLDPGYLSRLVSGLERRGLLQRARSESDGRRNVLTLTERGQQAHGQLDAGSVREVGALLARLSESAQARLVDSMQTIETLLRPAPEPRPTYLLRPPYPGELGWVIARHGALYAREYHWDETFEALVAEIVTAYMKEHDPRRERCWIAERGNEPVGSVFLVRASDEVAKLRLLLVEPHARGLGIGERLVDECVRTARLLGYRRMTLWTQSVLLAARTLYVRAGFRLVREEPARAFGHDLVSETWEMEL